jgi:sortase A
MIAKILLIVGLICLAVYGYVAVQAHFQQEKLEQELYQPLKEPPPTPNTSPAVNAGPAVRKRLKEGDLFGKLEIPRLDMKVMVMEGDESRILRLGAGHIPGTLMAIAGHRDTFFRPLKDIKLSDKIRITTPENTTEYRVVSTKIVGPKDTWVLDDKSDNKLTLITCYPFYYVGPSPKRFIVEAVKN